jgi:alcohol dehydrogenase
VKQSIVVADPISSTANWLMRANVFAGKGRCGLMEMPVPRPGPGEAVIQVEVSTISPRDLAILRGSLAMAAGHPLGEEFVGTIHELGPDTDPLELGDRVLAGGIPGGAQSEFVLVSNASRILAKLPKHMRPEEALLLAGPGAAGFAAAAATNFEIGDNVAVYQEGPVGLCAVAGARLMGAAHVIAIDSDADRLLLAQKFGATDVVQANRHPSEAILDLTHGRGVRTVIHASERSPASQVVNSAALSRLMQLVETHKVDLFPLITHRFRLEDVEQAYGALLAPGSKALKVLIDVC